jgi:hypothetical protein
MFVKDPANNLNRRCDIMGRDAGRHWLVERAMQMRGCLCYLVRHDETGEFRVATIGGETELERAPIMVNVW